jgi:hypothetical protein
MDPLEEKKGHHKEAPVQTYPQIGPGRRVHQGGEEFGDLQRVLREEDPRQPCLTLAKGRQGSSQGVGQGMETIGEQGQARKAGVIIVLKFCSFE